MDSGAPTEVVIRFSRGKLILLVLAAAVFGALCMWAWAMADGKSLIVSLLIKAAAIAGILTSVVFGLWHLFKVLDTRPALIIDAQGIVDNSGAMAVGKILWDDVLTLGADEMPGRSFIEIIVADRQKFTRRGNIIAKVLRASDIRTTDKPIRISPMLLDVKFDELVQALTSAFETHKRQPVAGA